MSGAGGFAFDLTELGFVIAHPSMSVPTHSSGRLFWRGAAVAAMVLLLGLMVRFHEPGVGWTKLLSVGELLGKPTVTALRGVPHHVDEFTHGYDGRAYVQLALHPLLGSPELDEALDDPSYRARRIFLPWMAWLLGLGQPAWIVQIYSLLNVACWLALAVILWRWLPPDGSGNFLRWAGVMFSHGVCMSVRHSLTDLPGLLLVTLAVLAWEKRRRLSAIGAMAAAALTKETSVLAGVLWAGPPVQGGRWWARLALTGALVVAPLACWLVYVRWRFGAGGEGVGNFTLPLVGLVQKWGATLGEIRAEGWTSFNRNTLLTVIALTVQMGFMLCRWRPAEAWWRIGAMFAVLGLLVAQPVWEGHPGAATRVILPMTLAFNLLVPRGRAWLPLLLAGNLSVFSGVAEFTSHRAGLLYYRGESQLVSQQTFERGEGWYLAELKGWKTRRWCRQTADITLHNHATGPVEARLELQVSAVSPRTLSLRLDGVELWRGELAGDTQKFITPAFKLPAGRSRLEFHTDLPAEKPVEGDERELSFCVWGLLLEVRTPAPESPARD